MKFSQTKLKDLTGKYGSPLIVYNEQELIESYEYLAASLGGAKLVYSVKANPNPGIIKTLSENDAMFETASEIEYKLLRRIGINPLRIIYGGQGKKKEGIRQAIQEGVFLFNLESQHEVKLLVECAEEEKKKCEFLLRINPENSSKVSVLQMSGCPSAFGIDVEYVDETLELCKSKYAKFVGFFMYNGSQYYDACEIVNNTKYLVELAKKYSGKYEIEYLDFGGGFGGLARLYDFCVLEQIEDLEKLEIDQIERFQKTFTTEYQRHYYAGVTYWCGRALFMEAEEIHWDANVWYMDRMHLQPERIDPAAPVMSLSFAEVTNKENRKLLQKYLRYGIGITNISISSLRTEFLVVRKFLGDMNQPETENICMVTEQQMDAWLRSEQQREVQADTFNKKVMCILHFFQYLQIKDYITAIPFDPNYYLKKTFMQHHDRSVAQETMDQIRRNLYRFPEEVRLMYLHLWGVGLRISEVCTLKGNAYYLQGKDAWIQVYQTKMRTYKRIPIPMTLYQLMQVYITKYQRKAEEYIFQNRNGGAYRKTTFQQTMKRLCEECNIQNGEYLFKSHDYRHTLATTFYDVGVPIQSIRDYLGHEYEEMTLQYLDYMPKRIENANEEYFKRKSLASCLRKGAENGEQNLYQGNDTVQSDCVDETAGEVYNWGPVL